MKVTSPHCVPSVFSSCFSRSGADISMDFENQGCGGSVTASPDTYAEKTSINHDQLELQMSVDSLHVDVSAKKQVEQITNLLPKNISSNVNHNRMSSRVSYLSRRSNRLKHKMRKLQMCQIGLQVAPNPCDENSSRSKSNFMIMKKKLKCIPEDSDDTDSDSSSCNDNDHDVSVKSVNPNHKPKWNELEKLEASKNEILEDLASQNAQTYNKWQWLQFQIQGLEFKILQTNETLRKIRSQELKAKFDTIPFALSADGSTEETISAARIRGLESHPKKKLVSTLNVITQSKNELPFSGIPCSCPPNLCCIICGGPGVLHVQNPSPLSDFCRRRIEIVHPTYHKVICAGKMPLSVQYGRLIKGRKWNSRASLASSKNDSAAAKIDAGSSDSLLQTKKARQTQLQRLLEVKKKTRSKKPKKNKGTDEKSNKATSKDGNKPLTSVESAAGVENDGNNSDSKKTSRSSSPGLSKSLFKDPPYIPDLSESSGESSDDEQGCKTNLTTVISKPKANNRSNMKNFIVGTTSKESTEPQIPRTTQKTSVVDPTSNEVASESKPSGNEQPTNSSSLKKVSSETEIREDIVIPLSNSLPLFEPVIYKTIETPQWRTKWIDPLPMKNVGIPRQETLEEMSVDKYAAMHYRFEHEEKVKSAGLHRQTNPGSMISNLVSKPPETRSLASSGSSLGAEEDIGSGPYEKRDFPLTQRQLLDFNKTVTTRNHDFFDVL